MIDELCFCLPQLAPLPYSQNTPDELFALFINSGQLFCLCQLSFNSLLADKGIDYEPDMLQEAHSWWTLLRWPL